MAQTTAFTYQGRLDHTGSPANGSYDFRFTIYNAASDGSAISGSVTNDATVVSNGLFTVTLDFGSVPFDGSNRWLDIGVRTNGSGDTFTTLNPRQPITSAPYAITAARLSGTVPNGGIGGAYSNAVIFNNPANQFTGSFIGNGSALSNVNATTLGGLNANQFWKLAGNAGTAPGANFIGTTDGQPFELKVANDRVFRFEPALEVPNIVGGSRSNFVTPGVRGATIAGGGLPLYPNFIEADYGAIGGGTFHGVTGPWGTIAGGRDNRVHAESATIAGGFRNNIGTNAFVATIGGGVLNAIQTNVSAATIGGGDRNIISFTYGTISGGVLNRAEGGPAPTVGGGDQNVAGGHYTTVGGGRLNTAIGFTSTLGGGSGNMIETNADHATIAGGLNNRIQRLGFRGVIGGGQNNLIETNVFGGTIGGGTLNRIGTNSSYATIAGGSGNVISNGPVSFGPGAGTIGGGFQNYNSGWAATIAGGWQNIVTGTSDFIGGGTLNSVSNNNSAVVGGSLNTVLSERSIIGGGGNNTNQINSEFSVIGGGFQNVIRNDSGRSVIGGGYSNTISPAGFYATIPGGEQNSAAAYGFSAGRRARGNHTGAFVWADSTAADFPSTAANQFSVRASGGVRFVTSGAGVTLDGQPILSGTVSSGQITDGASLTEILDDDGPGSGLNADLLDGLDSTAFAPASHNHFGESWIGAANTGLSVTTTSSAPGVVAGILGRQGAGSGFGSVTPGGVWGDSEWGLGVLGTAALDGVLGWHTHSNSIGSGVRGFTASSGGRGVSGTAAATNGPTVGVSGEVRSPAGIGLYGLHNNTTGTSAGVHGDTHSTAGSAVGVLGQVTSTAPGGFSAGVRGINNGTGSLGIGVYGSHAGGGWGVNGTANSGIGVRGTSTSGAGLVGVSTSSNPIEAYSSTDREFYVSNTGSVFADGPYSGAGADFAELLPAKEGLEPGDVLVVDDAGQMTRSTEAAQENVVGVYSTQPGFLGGADENGNNAGKVPLAVIGVVPVKVTGENGAIKPGNLLVTSSTPGHAMKAGADRRVGTIIGKALTPFNGSSGVIQMLVVLQ